MRKFMVGKYVGGCVKTKGQLLIDLTNCIHILQCLKCRCHVFGSFVALSSLASTVTSHCSRFATPLRDLRRQ